MKPKLKRFNSQGNKKSSDKLKKNIKIEKKSSKKKVLFKRVSKSSTITRY